MVGNWAFLARDPRVFVGWPLPLGFGLDGRLLLARRGRVMFNPPPPFFLASALLSGWPFLLFLLAPHVAPQLLLFLLMNGLTSRARLRLAL